MTEYRDGGVVVSEEVFEALLASFKRWSPYRIEPTWEERLVQAIELRSLRFRWRVLRMTVTGRLGLAVDVLLGRHYCGDDD